MPRRNRDELSHLVLIDAPLPGTAVFDRLRTDPRVWHFAFHGARDVAEMLVAGRERQYLQAFFSARIFDPAAISDRDLDVDVSAHSAPGAMRAGFELYRAFDQDADDNREALKRYGKLTVPVLVVGRRNQHLRTARRRDDAGGGRDRHRRAHTADGSLDPRGERNRADGGPAGVSGEVRPNERGGTMIARIWTGAVRQADGDAYAEYMRDTGVAGYEARPGNRGVWMLRRDVGDRTEFLMFTLWDSLDAIMAFAGEDYETAVFYPEDERFLIERDLRATHYEVVASAREEQS